MDTFLVLLQRMIVLVLISSLGFFAQRRGILDENGQTVGREILLKLAVPFAILSSLPAEGNPLLRQHIPMLFGIAIASLLVFFLAAHLVCHLCHCDRSERAGVIMSLMFGNTLFVGLPLAEVAFGSEGVFFLAVFNIVGTVVCWTYGVSVCQPEGKIDLKKLFFNPAAIASVVLLILVCLEVRLPVFLTDTFSIMGKMSTPLSMLLVGAMLANMKFREVFAQPLGYLVSVLRLLVIPYLFFFFMRLLNVPNELIRVAVVCIAIPAGSLNPNIVRAGGLDPAPINSMVVISTLLSIVTIPVSILYVDWLIALPL